MSQTLARKDNVSSGEGRCRVSGMGVRSQEDRPTATAEIVNDVGVSMGQESGHRLAASWT